MIFDADNVLIYTLAYKDFDRTAVWLSSLRRMLPKGRVVIQVDGDDDERYLDLPAAVLTGERLYDLPHGGAIIKRMLQTFVSSGRRVLLRVDNDTEFLRPPRHIPDADYFGSRRTRWNFIQGGCIGLSRQVALRAISDNVCDLPYLNYPTDWVPTPETGRVRNIKHNMLCFDWLLAHIMTQMCVVGEDWGEAAVFWKPERLEQWLKEHPDADPAIVHPIKHCQVNRAI